MPDVERMNMPTVIDQHSRSSYQIACLNTYGISHVNQEVSAYQAIHFSNSSGTLTFAKHYKRLLYSEHSKIL